MHANALIVHLSSSGTNARMQTYAPLIANRPTFASGIVVSQILWERYCHGERASAYNGGLGAEPPAGSRGRVPGQQVRGRSP